MAKPVARCKWAEGVSLPYIEYHDKEWGVPVHDDRVQFEFLVLEGAQAGLSWSTILNKREGYRHAFAAFALVTVDWTLSRFLTIAGFRNSFSTRFAVKRATFSGSKKPAQDPSPACGHRQWCCRRI